MAEVNVSKLDKSALRKMASEFGVPWDKRTDDENTIRKKLKKVLEAAEEPEATGDFDVTKREPLEVVTDAKTNKKIKQPVGCFGWLYTPDDKHCTQTCPHAKQCKPLSKSAPAAYQALEVERREEEEVDATDEEDVKKANKALKKKSKEVEPEKAKRKGVLTEKTVLRINYDLDWCNSVKDETLRKFYKRCFFRHAEASEHEKKVDDADDTLTVKQAINYFLAFVDGADRDEIRTEFISEFVSNDDFQVVE